MVYKASTIGRIYIIKGIPRKDTPHLYEVMGCLLCMGNLRENLDELIEFQQDGTVISLNRLTLHYVFCIYFIFRLSFTKPTVFQNDVITRN